MHKFNVSDKHLSLEEVDLRESDIHGLARDSQHKIISYGGKILEMYRQSLSKMKENQ